MKTHTAQEIGQTNDVNLCDSCCHIMPTCAGDNLIFGTGRGSDNVIACDTYKAITFRDPKYQGQEL